VLHARPPRINCLFWLRPAHCVRFTSLRDMSLRRNSQPPLRADAALWLRSNTALMRDLRA
jgi:hypothetical protein